MHLDERFVKHLKEFPSIQQKQKQLLAVSGGADSIVLCDLMFTANYDFVIAHCNFQLRGAESARDEQFVRTLGEKYNKEVLVRRFDTEKYASENKVSIQVAARELRYSWFYELISNEEGNNEQLTTNSLQRTTNNEHLTTDNEHPATAHSKFTTYNLQHILTAHHANDNIETVLINFFKGTGIAGLHGIVPVQGKIVRPLLFAKKDELLIYANENNLQFVEDTSNLSDKYTRNFFRLRLFPMLKEIYPNVEDNLLHNIHRFTETEELYKQAVEQHKKKAPGN